MSDRVVAALKLQDAYREQQHMKEVHVEVDMMNRWWKVRSGCHSMRIVGPLTVLKHFEQSVLPRRIRLYPLIDVLCLDRDDAAIVSCGSNLRRRFVRDRRERQQV